MKKGFLLVLFTLSITIAQAPSFEDGGTIKCAGSEINVGHGCPCVVDWDGDGLQDLLIGQFYDDSGNYGKIRLYLNSGSTTAPVLTSYSFLQAGGNDISLSTG